MGRGPSSAVPPLQHRQEGQVRVAQVGSAPVLEDVADGRSQRAVGVVQRAHRLAVRSQLQDQRVAPQQDFVPAQRDHLRRCTKL